MKNAFTSIRKQLGIVRPEPSTYRLLLDQLNEDQRRTVVNLTPDWRDRFAAAAALTARDAGEVVEELAKKLGHRYLDSLDGIEISVPPAVDLALGILPVIVGCEVTGVVCLDPARIKFTTYALGHDRIFIARWDVIKKAVAVAESTLARSGRDDHLSDSSLGRDVFQAVVDEAQAVGAVEFTVVPEGRYTLTLASGKKASGTIVPNALPNLLAFLELALANPIGADLRNISVQSEDGAFVCSFLRRDEESACLWVLEDDEDFGELISRLFDGTRFVVEYFTDVVSLRNEWRKRGAVANCLIFDKNVGHASSISLLAELRALEENFSIPAILVSSDDRPETFLSALHAGFNACISKGSDIRLIRGYVERLVR